MAPRKQAAGPLSAPKLPAVSIHQATPKKVGIHPIPSSPSPKRATRIFRIILRVFGLCAILQWLYFKYVTPPPDDETSFFVSDTYPPIELDLKKRDAVLEAFRHSYTAYERDAFGYDNYHPISHTGTNMSPKGPVGYFLVDSLDSLLLMGLDEEYKRARDWVSTLNLNLDDRFHTFEITIRVLGGLLSAYELSGHDKMLLNKAVDLADRLLPAFDSPFGIPYSFVNLARRKGIPDLDNKGYASVAEAGTLQLEFKYLSQLTGNSIYWEKVENVMRHIRTQPSKDGLVPIFLSPESGKFIFSDFRLGSRGDSYYEYLLKQYLQTNKTEPTYKKMHDDAMLGVKKHLLKFSASESLVYTSELLPRKGRDGKPVLADTPKQDHLVCFLGGSLILGATADGGQASSVREDLTDSQQDDMYAGTSMIKTCVDTYQKTKTGLAPEIVNFYRDAKSAKNAGREWFINSRKAAAPNPPIDARNILRPETVESLFIAYRITGNPVYRKWGWEIFQAFSKHCRLTGGGFASIYDVEEVPVKHEDRMETFWISETLKYLYLLFSESTLIPLDTYVFNTEAHILPVFTPSLMLKSN